MKSTFDNEIRAALAKGGKKSGKKPPFPPRKPSNQEEMAEGEMPMKKPNPFKKG